MSGEFEAQILTKTGEVLDVVITTSRIFFLKKKGHVVSVRKILRRKENDIAASYGGTQYYPGSIFVTKKIGEIMRSLPENGILSLAQSAKYDTPVFEA